MRFRFTDSRSLTGLALCGFMLAAAGCQSGDSAGALDFGGGDSGKKEVVLESDLRAYCPQVKLREGTALIKSYAKGGQDNPEKLAYQASIAEVTRNCARNGGMMTINVAVAGRVVPGPAVTPGTITMPIRVVVMRGEEVIYSQLHNYPVSVGQTAGASQFVFNDPNVVIPIPEPGTIQAFAGYDEGPAPKNR